MFSLACLLIANTKNYKKWVSFRCGMDFMLTSWKGNISALLALWRESTPHKGQSRRALMFSLICAWTTGWINDLDGGDLRRHRAHYDVTLMLIYDARSILGHRVTWNFSILPMINEAIIWVFLLKTLKWNFINQHIRQRGNARRTIRYDEFISEIHKLYRRIKI